MTKLAFLGCLLLLPALAFPEEPKLPNLAPFVRTMLPPGGQRGETLEITLRGRILQDTDDMSFTSPGLSAEICSADFYEVKAIVTVGKDVPVGIHEYRLTTPRGTYVGVFHVNALPRVEEKEPNNDLAKAQTVKLPAAIDGVIDNADYDSFRFHADAGQTVVMDLLASRIGSPLDAKLALFDDRGEEVQANDDTYLSGDPHLAFTAPKAGDYTVQVSHAFEFGNRDFAYRLLLGSFPHMYRVLPLAAQRGRTAELELAGVNLHLVKSILLGPSVAKGEILSASTTRLRFRLEVPASAATGHHMLYALSSDGEAPVPLAFLVSDVEERLSTSPLTRAQPQEILAPVAVSGLLDSAKGQNFFSFHAGAGQRLEFEVNSMRLGYPLDAALAIYDESGRQLAFQDDPAQPGPRQVPNSDPLLVHKFEKEGKHVAMVRDSGQRGNPNYFYRLSVRPAQPDFELQVASPSATWYRGRENPIEVRVRRMGGWDTPVEVWLENLPPGAEGGKGVAEPKNSEYKDNCAKLQMVDGTDVELKVRIAADAAPGARPITIHARGVIDGKTVEHSEGIFAYPNFVSRLSGNTADKKLLAMIAELPPALIGVPESFTVTAAKTDKLKVNVQRFERMDQPLTLELEALPAGVTVENNVLAPNSGQVELSFKTAKDAKPGSYMTTIRGGSVRTQYIELKIVPGEEKKPEEKK